MSKKELLNILIKNKNFHDFSNTELNSMSKDELNYLLNLVNRDKKIMTGSGIMDSIKDAISGLKSWLFFPPNKLPPKSAKVFEKYAKKKIRFIEIRRAPLQSYVKKFLNLISFGALEKKLKELNYDDIFHLSIFLIFEDGSKITVEKNERINIAEGYTGPAQEMESTNAHPRKIITLEELLGKAQQSMGDHAFFQYNARDNNCQNFVLRILKANDLLTPSLEEFIKQNAVEIFKSLPSFMDKFAQGITDLAGKVSQITQGGKKKKGNKKKKTRKIRK